jgi:hypothetical protein
MSMKGILKAHIKELLNQGVPLFEERMKICKVCPLYDTGPFGPICNPNLYLNPTTNKFNYIGGSGFTKGCGCRLNAKTRDKDAHCPSQLW